MKPTSIVFLVVAVLFIIGGMITCSVAQNIAETDGYLLFSDTEDGGTYRREDFSDQAITKLELVIQDAEISVFGTSDASYIEIINFRDGLYTFSTSGKIVSLDELLNVQSFFDLSKGFSFSGIRYLLQTKQPEGVRRVNVYLNELAAESLKSISVNGRNCKLHIENLPAVCDITLTASESLTVTANALHTSSSLSIESPVSDLTIENAAFNAVTLKAQHGYIEAQNMFFKALTLEADEGDFDITAPISLSDYNIEIGNGTGKINVGGMDRPRPYSAPATAETPVGDIKLISEKADFSIKEIKSAQ